MGGQGLLTPPQRDTLPFFFFMSVHLPCKRAQTKKASILGAAERALYLYFWITPRAGPWLRDQEAKVSVNDLAHKPSTPVMTLPAGLYPGARPRTSRGVFVGDLSRSKHIPMLAYHAGCLTPPAPVYLVTRCPRNITHTVSSNKAPYREKLDTYLGRAG